MKSRISTLFLCAFLTLSLTSCSGSKNVMDQAGSLMSLVSGKPDLSTFLSLVQAAGLGDMLGGANPLTLLAPSNAAFSALGASAVSNLMKSENKSQLTDILNNHIVSGALSASDLGGASSATSMLGTALNVSKAASGGGLSVGGANVVESLQGSNGFVHIVDKVIMP